MELQGEAILTKSDKSTPHISFHHRAEFTIVNIGCQICDNKSLAKIHNPNKFNKQNVWISKIKSSRKWRTLVIRGEIVLAKLSENFYSSPFTYLKSSKPH